MVGSQCSCRQWAAVACCHGRRECGKQPNEGGHDCFTSSIIVTGFSPLSLVVAWLSSTKTSCQPHKTNHFRCEVQTKPSGSPLPPRGSWVELTFQDLVPKTSVNDGVRSKDSHAGVQPFHLTDRISWLDAIYSLIRQRGSVD